MSDPSPLHALWGRFRCWERTQAPRLSAGRLKGARRAWLVVVEQTPRAAASEVDLAGMIYHLADLEGDERQGAGEFLRWAATELRAMLEASRKRPVQPGDASHTTDSIQATLL